MTSKSDAAGTDGTKLIDKKRLLEMEVVRERNCSHCQVIRHVGPLDVISVGMTKKKNTSASSGALVSRLRECMPNIK